MRGMDADVLKCPLCHSEELSPEGSYASFDNHARFRAMGGKGMFSTKDLVVQADRARVCLDCGYLMMFVRNSDREKLKAATGA